MGLLSFLKSAVSRRSASRTSVSEVVAGFAPESDVIKDIQYDSSQIDYTVFTRRQGIFVIRVVHDRGRAVLDGKTLLLSKKPRPDIIQNALRDAFFVKSMIRDRVGIDASVTPIVVLDRAALGEDGSLLGVLVTTPSGLANVFTHAPQITPLPEGALICLRELQMMRVHFLRR